MHTGTGQVLELILEDGQRLARISCPADLVPAPGQYLLAGAASSSDPLPVPLFFTESAPSGFIASAPLTETWLPGQEIALRGPLGRGFELPATSRKVALVPCGGLADRLRGLIRLALGQGAAVVLVSDTDGEHLPDEVEVQPLAALEEVLAWADYVAFDVERGKLPGLRERLGQVKQVPAGKEAQVLVRTPVPCGGVAECGVCALTLKSSLKLACKDGPVFDLREI